MDFETITYSVTEQVARIGLNRPKVLNALNRRLVGELDRAASEIAASKEVRAVVVTGEGGNFAAGADISEMVDLAPSEASSFGFSPVFNSLADLPMPVIAAMDGFALGGGLELALACDLRICTAGARFGLPEIKLGIFPGAGGTQRLPRLVGHGRAKELIYTGRIIDADTAFCLGALQRDRIRRFGSACPGPGRQNGRRAAPGPGRGQGGDPAGCGYRSCPGHLPWKRTAGPRFFPPRTRKKGWAPSWKSENRCLRVSDLFCLLLRGHRAFRRHQH